MRDSDDDPGEPITLESHVAVIHSNEVIKISIK
ncbi:MAG: hypothetical protein HFI30_11970 [Lachnospiraceae bacterium]|nr:hypothetical protein [Lachnospiraceae bacterium]